ncbi:MAG: methyltransferase [Alphaproteobacteria bacterium]|nr:methyltransferase [Alphaproteobacteria bacterium]
MNHAAWTVEHPVPGLRLHQPARSFRYAAEAFWLVGLALEGGVPPRALDLGTGSGILAALLAAQGAEVLGVDRHPGWSEGWQRTLGDSRLAGRLTLEVADVATLRRDPVDLVVSNPPFFAASAGPVSSDPLRASARTESTAPLAAFVACACRHLLPGGRACLVVPRAREEELLDGVPAGYGARRRLRVGRVRSLVVLAPGAASCAPEQLDDRGPEVAAWYARARAVAPGPARG